MNEMRFTFSDTVAGYVQSLDRERDTYVVKTSDDREFAIKLKGSTYAMLVRNLGEPYHDATGQIRELLTPGRYVLTYGVFYPEGGSHTFEAQFLIFLGRRVGEYVFERPDWWVNQIESLGEFYVRAQFGEDQPVDYDNYRTTITLTGESP